MTTRKRPSATDTAKLEPEKPTPAIHQADSPIRPAKFFTIFKIFLIFSIPYFFLLFSYCKIEYELKKPIFINWFLSFIGFFVTVSLIPVASKYVSRRNLFGYDINKKGTPDGSIKVWVQFLHLFLSLIAEFSVMNFKSFCPAPYLSWLNWQMIGFNVVQARIIGYCSWDCISSSGNLVSIF